MVSSSQEVPPDPQRRLESKDLPSIRCLGKGLSGFIYETTWLGNRYTRKNGNRYTRKDFPLGSAKHNYVFEKEVKFLFDLNHPNIVKCFGYTIGKSSCSLLQEYEDDNLQNTVEKRIEAQRKTKRVSSGSTLRSRVLDVEEINSLISSKVEEIEITDVSSKMDESTIPFELPQELPQAVDIISQIATGMEYLHDNGIAHGDLKPNNVLVTIFMSGEMKVKVADFGLIETKKRIKLVSKRTRHFEILMWKAPERLEKLLGPQTKNSDDPFTESDTNSDEEIGSSDNFLNSRLAMADVYSFGLIFSYIFGGELMYSNLSLTQLRTQRSNGFRPKMPSACPGYLKFIISSCLQFEPSKRPTFFDICTMLKGAISELPRLMRVGEMKKDGHLVGEMKKDGHLVGEMKKDGHLVGEMKNNGVVGEMKKDDLVGEMKKDDLVGEMKKDDLVGEMKKNDLVGEMKKDDLVGEMKKNDLVGEMKKGDPIGELKKEENIEGKSIYKNLEQPLPTKPHYLTNIPFLPYEDVYQGMMKDKNLEQPSLNRSRDVKSYFFPAKIQGFRLRGRSRPYSAEEEKICKGVYTSPHSIEKENTSEGVNKSPQSIEEGNGSEGVYNMANIDDRMHHYFQESHDDGEKAPRSNRPIRQRTTSVKNSNYCGALLMHKGFRKRNNYTVSYPAWENELTLFREQYEFEMKQMKENVQLDVLQEIFQKFKSKRMASSGTLPQEFKRGSKVVPRTQVN